ncbi:MAG TPA: zf-HC2 domain-containing protein [bacterium]|nr:zf-HC2 domain-containing protein [bacterium]
MHDQKCELNELFIEQFIDNELDFEESAQISAHIETCRSCKAVYDELKFIRNVITGMKETENLSPIEKEGFYNLIEKECDKKVFLSKLGNFFSNTNHKYSIWVFSTSFVLLTIVFSAVLLRVDSGNSLIIQEIISAHDNNFPHEFNVTRNDDTVVPNPLKQLKIDKKVIRELSRISPVLRGRYTSIGAMPMAKIKLENNNGQGTLFMSKKNDRIKNVFQDAPCIVKHADGKSCKAAAYHENGKDIVYWDSQDNEYVFVSENQQLHSKMINLINNY